jgi:hypothetical protein
MFRSYDHLQAVTKKNNQPIVAKHGNPEPDSYLINLKITVNALV